MSCTLPTAQSGLSPESTAADSADPAAPSSTTSGLSSNISPYTRRQLSVQGLNGTWECRVHRKCDELRQLFGLPCTEVCKAFQSYAYHLETYMFCTLQQPASSNLTAKAPTWSRLGLQSPIEDFHCALQKKICLQGRLYLFQHHVCFYSNLFGFIKSKVIPLQVHTACCSFAQHLSLYSH